MSGPIDLKDVFTVCVEMPGPQWFAFVQKIGRERNARWHAARETEATQLEQSMDMTPEGYVREWVKRGRRGDVLPLEAWEYAYQRRNIIERAKALGYIEIDRSVYCNVKLTEKGEAIARTLETTP